MGSYFQLSLCQRSHGLPFLQRFHIRYLSRMSLLTQIHSSREYAWATHQIPSSSPEQHILHRILTLQNAPSNVVTPVEYYLIPQKNIFSDKSLHVIMNLPHNTLQQLFWQRIEENCSFGEEEIWDLLVGVVRGMEYFQRKKIVILVFGMERIFVGQDGLPMLVDPWLINQQVLLPQQTYFKPSTRLLSTNFSNMLELAKIVTQMVLMRRLSHLSVDHLEEVKHFSQDLFEVVEMMSDDEERIGWKNLAALLEQDGEDSLVNSKVKMVGSCYTVRSTRYQSD